MPLVNSIKDIVSKINDGMIIGLSGFSYQNPPMTIVREIIRQGKKNLILVSGPTSGIETDILIGAGCIAKVITAGVSFEKLAGIAPNFRKSCEDGSVKLWECDETIWHLAIGAGISGKDFVMSEAPVGTSIPLLNSEISEIRDNNKSYLKIPAIKLDVAVVHVTYADNSGNLSFGNNLFRGRMFCEKKLLENASLKLASVEKIVDKLDTVPEVNIGKADYVVECAFGAHPGGCNGVYVPDLEHYGLYLKFVKEGKFLEYLKEFVLINDYLGKIGKSKLDSLKIK